MKYTHAISRLAAPILVAASLVALTPTGSPPAAAAADNGTITSDGPLTSVQTSADLNCAVNHVGDSAPEFFGATACGTFVAVDGTLYGPADVPAGGGASPRTPWTPQSQTSSGSGTAQDPYRIVTVVTGGELRVTQTDLYVVGSESYSTRVDVLNTGPLPSAVTVYRAADCYLQNSDVGYGASDATAGSVACTADSAPGSRVEQWAPLTPGSKFFESRYSTVWSYIGAQQEFPNTSDDTIYQDNGAGLSWRTTIWGGASSSFSHLTAFSPTGADVSDSDHDGFPDTWESADGGVDTNADGTVDYKLSDFGATPDKPDVFVQVNWTQTRNCTLIFFCNTTQRRPSLAALRDVQSAFAAHGVRLHIDAGPDSLMNPDNGATWATRSRVSNSGISAPNTIAGWDDHNQQFNWSASYDALRTTALTDTRRARIFHLAMYIGRFNPGGSSGISRSGSDGIYAGRDFLFAYDIFGARGPNRIEESGTFMHELGHNLGLSHGGDRVNDSNYKPNFPSVMNYFWQMSGVPKNDHLALLDYSEGTLAPIDENSLDERAGLEPDSAANDIGTSWACPNGNPRTHDGETVFPSVRDIDWNCDGSIASTPVQANVTGIINSGQRNDTTHDVLADHNDWANLVFDGGGSLGGAGDPLVAPATTTNEEPTFDELAAVAVDHHPVGITGLPGQLVIQAETSASVPLVITNHRDAAVTYQLSAASAGLTVSGLPAQVTLSAGQAQTIPVVLTAGPVTDAAYVEIDADGGDSSNSASVSSQAYVVAEPVPDQPPVIGQLDHLTVDPPAATIVAGGSRTYTVTGFDLAGHNLGTPTGLQLTISPDGSCSTNACTAETAGAHVVTAAAPFGAGRVNASATLEVTAGPATTLVAASGDGQSASKGQTFAQPLKARVTDAYGNPVSGTTVKFTITSGATFTSGGSTSNAVSAADGVATSSQLRAGNTTGPFTVIATAGQAAPVTFAETVTDPVATRADLSLGLTAPVSARVGTQVKVTLKVTNRGPSAASKTVALLNVPYGMRLVDAGGGKLLGSAIVFNVGTLPTGATASRTVTLSVTGIRLRTRTLYGLAVSATPDPAPLNNLSRTAIRIL